MMITVKDNFIGIWKEVAVAQDYENHWNIILGSRTPKLYSHWKP
jgi:primosomal protein N'